MLVRSVAICLCCIKQIQIEPYCQQSSDMLVEIFFLRVCSTALAIPVIDLLMAISAFHLVAKEK